MEEKHNQHPIASIPGAAAVAVWSGYVLLAAFYYSPDIPLSAWPIGFCGLLACLAVILNFTYWRLIVMLASFVYLAFYVTRIARMVAMTTDFSWSTLPTTLSFYYQASWSVSAGMLQEKGVAGAFAHGYLEYAMPILSLALIGVVWMSRRPGRRQKEVTK
jgi:hypothetical protein